MDKRQLCIRAINAINSIVNATHMKTLRFKNHNTIEDTRCKLIAIYNPLRHFSHSYLPGYDVSNLHETTAFNMNYREYWQRELYLILNDMYWVSQNIQVKYVFNCIEYKKLDLLAKICTKSSKNTTEMGIRLWFICVACIILEIYRNKTLYVTMKWFFYFVWNINMS